MKNIYVLLIFLIHIFEVKAQAPSIQWQKTLGGSSAEFASSIVQTSDGGYIVAGNAKSTDGDVTTNLGGGYGDVWIVKLSVIGTIQWQKSLGGSGNDGATSIVKTSDGGYIIAGYTQSTDGDVTGLHSINNNDYWVVKLSNIGTIQWQKTLGGSSLDVAYSIIETSDGGYAIAGKTLSNDGDVTGNHGGYDFWIVKLSVSGNIQWQKTFGGSGGDEAFSIIQTNDGGYTVVGSTGSNDGDVTGLHGISGNDHDYWVVKLNSSGIIQWQKTLGGTYDDGATSVVQSIDSGFVIAGFTSSTNGDVTGNHGYYDFWVVKLNNTGYIEWEKALGGSGYDEPWSIILDTDGGYVVTGKTVSNNGDVIGNHGGDDFWVTKLSSIGALQWQKTLGGSNGDDATSITKTSDGGYAIAGYTVSNDSDVTGNHSAGLYNDYWVVKLGSTNSPQPSFYPYITLSSGVINQSQTITIKGFQFTSSNKANLVITGPSSFQTSFTVSTSGTGTFSYNFPTTVAMPIGQYTVNAVDSITGIYAPVKSFVLTNNQNSISKLSVLAPSTNDTLFVNDTSLITWTDKLVVGQSYTVNGAQRNYKYNIEYSSNNGANWQTLTTVQGAGYVNAVKTFHAQVAFSNTGSNYLIRVTDYYNTANADSSGILKVINQSTTATNIKADLYWDFSYANQNNALYGVAADGSARVYLVISKINSGAGSTISNVSVQLADGWNNSTTTLGKVMAATQVSTYDNEANSANSLTATQSTEAFSRHWFWYVAPDDFTGNNPNDVNSAYRTIKAHFVINYSNSTAETFDKIIKIVRPPLCFVHGLASDPSTWDDFRHNAFGYELNFLNDSRFYTKKAIQLDAKQSFSIGAQQLTIGFQNPNSISFQNSLQGVIRDLRNQGYATNRCDYIGHSMGGCVLRSALDNYSDYFYRTGNASNRDYKNYGRGYVNKTITINTPHNSSPWADILNRYTPDLTYGMRLGLQLDYGQFPNSLPFSFITQDNSSLLVPTFKVVDAVKNLQIDQNQGGVNFGTSNLKAHLIGSDFFPGIQNTTNNMIPQSIINVVDQAAEEVDFLNKFLELTIAEEQDQQVVSDLIEVTDIYDNPVQTALEYIERMADLYNTAMFIPESDLVVGVSSQLADNQRTAPNVTVFDNYIGHAFIRPILGDVDAGNRVNDLLNARITSNEFNLINATSNKKEGPSLNSLLGDRSVSTIVSYRDLSKLKILSPTSNAQLATDSIVTIKISLSDTTNLISYKIKFQNKTYKLSRLAGAIDLNIQVNSNLLDSNYIFAEAFFKRPDTSFFFFDTVLVNVTTTSTLIGFGAKQKIIYLNINQTKTPDYVSYYNGFATSVSNFSRFISANVANGNILSYNPQYKSFKGLATGETSAIVSYKGLSDTIYFVVGENTLDSLSTGIAESNLLAESRPLKLLCYPNPTNQKMTVDFDVATTGDVSIKVYDLLGQEQIMVLEEKMASGTYRASIDGAKLSNGIYICELRNASQRLVSRIAFTK